MSQFKIKQAIVFMLLSHHYLKYDITENYILNHFVYY